MKRDTSHQASLEGRESFSNNESGSSRLPDKPEIRENPQQKPEPEIEDYPRPEPEVEREPGQQDEPEREKEPERRRA